MIPPGGGGGKGGPALPQESSDSEHDHQEEPHQIQRIVVDNFLGKLIVNNFEKSEFTIFKNKLSRNN